MKLTKKLEAEVTKVYDTWLRSYLNGDVKTYDSYLDKEYHFIGSTDNEDFLTKNGTTKFFKTTADQLAGKSQIKNNIRTIEQFDGLVFITERFDANFLIGSKWVYYGKFRFSSVMQKKAGGWRFIYQHFSLPDSKAAEGETLGAEQVSKENQELRDAIKRRTAELEIKNRELEIETSLERVRAKTMAMQKSEELKEVIQVVYDQFIQLNIKIEHTGFVLDYKARNDYDIWIADQLEVPSHVTIPYFDCIYYNRFNEAKKKGEDFFATNLNFKEKNKFYKKLIEFIPGLPEETKKFLFSVPGLAASTVLLDNVCLYIENFEGIPYTAEENDVLMRFGKVFQQTYTRFLDLQKAEVQAREAEIELALERVRARTMAMQHSEELLDVASILFQQVKGLGVPQWNCGFNIWNLGDKEFTYYPGSPEGIISPSPCKIPLTKHPVFMRFDESRRRGDDLLIYEKQGEEQEDHYRYMLSLPGVGDLLRSMLDAGFELPAFQIDHVVNFAYGNLIFITFEHFPRMHDVFKRFAKVFEQTYTRFLDLQKSEAQAREAQIQLALERVRAKTMAMQKSDELPETSHILFEQMKELGEPVEQLTIGIVQEENNVIEISATLHGDTLKKIYLHSIDEPYMMTKVYKAWKTQQKTLIVELKGDELNSYNKYRNELTNSEMFPTNLGNEHRRIVYAAFFSKGMFALGANEPRPPQSLQLLERFASVFDLTYTRFLDLQKAEAQAREAKIEAALERIRGKVTAMRESTELLDIVVTMRNEFVTLGHEANYFWHMRWLPDKYEKAMTSGDGTRIGMVMTLPRHIHGDIKLVADWEKSNEPALIFAMDVETAVDYIDKMITLGDFELVDHNAPTLDDIRHIGGLTFVMARTTHGEIGYSLPGIIFDPPADDVATLARFAGVFDLAYKRFEDLKTAERDLIEIKAAKQKAEVALIELQSTQKQLIQSEKMASLGELTAGIAHEIQNPLNFVNNFSEVSKELLDEMKEAIEKGDTEEAKEIMNDVIQNLEKINHHGKRADGIVKGMLQHSSAGSGKKEPTDINALADEYLRLAYHGLRAKDKSFNATMKTDFDETIGNINIIPQDIGRVILNLITNAFYVVDEKKKQNPTDYEPTVTVSTKHLPLSSGEGRGEVRISVKDNGPGIPQKILDKIFQPFFTTKPTGQGTGLGLSLSYDIIKAHGGELKVVTKEAGPSAPALSGSGGRAGKDGDDPAGWGEGAEFIIQLPVV